MTCKEHRSVFISRNKSIIRKMKTRSLAPKGLIIGGVIVLFSTYDLGETIIPWYVKVIAGIGLIVVGVIQIIQERNKVE
jgi:hypothetical protein